MAKVTKTTYTRRAGAYRRFYRRYTRRYYRKFYNQMNKNYLNAKLDMNFSYGAKADNDMRYVFNSLDVQDYSNMQNFDIMDKIKDYNSMDPYMKMFNEMKLLGIKVRAVPILNGGTNNVNSIFFTYTFQEIGDPQAAKKLFLNPTTNTSFYLKNLDRKWVPTRQSQQVISQGKDFTFKLFTNVSGTGINMSLNPRWVITFTLYIKFRKNLLN